MLRVFLLIHLFFFFTAACSLPPTAFAAENVVQSRAKHVRESWNMLLYFENDLFYKTDRYYTNAVQVRFISPDLQTFTDNNVLDENFGYMLSKVPLPGSDNAVSYNISFGAGQHIYTPKDKASTELQKNDRPYAGYLYGSLALHAKKNNRLDTLELAAGVVGPSALSEQSQNTVHRLRGIDTADGWRHQLRDEPVAMLTWSRVWRLNSTGANRGWGWDVLPRVSASAGTPFTQAGVGGEVRFGWNLPPDFGSSIIKPGAGITAPSRNEDLGRRDKFWDNMGIHAFAGTEGRGVAHNTLLDGNTWKDSHSVDKFPFVGEFNWGIVLNVYDFSLSYSHVLRTKEFHGQEKGQNYGSISLGYRF